MVIWVVVESCTVVVCSGVVVVSCTVVVVSVTEVVNEDVVSWLLVLVSLVVVISLVKS